jgi:formylglycine-generating enzyme required for sulfatase activity
LVGGTAEAAPKKLSFVVAPGAPAFLINLAKKRTFAPCKTPPPKMLCIPGGIYVRGSQRNAQHANWKMRAESPRHYVILDTYYIDKYEVTHADFQKCLKAGRCKPSAFRLHPKHWRYPRFGTPTRPFVSATFYHARDYCRFAGKRLLTEAEWEAAARGPKGYTYPWGNSPPSCKKANYRVQPPRYSYPPKKTMRWCPHPTSKSKKLRRARQDQTWEVGMTPAYRGIYDMAGNGYEWVNDVYDPHAYAGCDKPNSPDCAWVNPKGPCGNKLKCKVKRTHTWIWKRVRVSKKSRKRIWKRFKIKYRRARTRSYSLHILKGGSWWWYADRMRGAHRRVSRPYTGMHRLSIRCATSTTTLNPLSPKPATPKKRRRRRRR